MDILEKLITQGLVDGESARVEYEWDREAGRYGDVVRFTRYTVHVTGPNHKNHRSTITVWPSGNVSIDRPWCGSASRWNAVQNAAINNRPVTCGRCGPCSDKCPVKEVPELRSALAES